MKIEDANFTNPETGKQEEYEVRVYSFEDWEKGIFSGSIEPGKIVFNTQEKRAYKILNKDEYKKIEEKRKVYYFKKVEKETEKLTSFFKERYERSENKERLLKNEVDNYNKLLFSNSNAIPEINRHGTVLPKGSDIGSIRYLYNKIIVNGERDFSLTNSPKLGVQIGSGDLHYIAAEAAARYYEFINTFKSQLPQEEDNKELLKSIWKNEPHISIDKTLQKGIDVGIWNDKYEITAKKNSLYGTGKTLLAALYVAFRNHSIKENLDYKIVGKKLCGFFNIEINDKTKEPYKSFQNANPKIIREFQKWL